MRTVHFTEKGNSVLFHEIFKKITQKYAKKGKIRTIFNLMFNINTIYY